jgi:D-alanyl-D-alanine carboxypeptidase
MLGHMTALGHDPVIQESVRSDARQAWLFGFGRDYDDGRGIVTQASTGEHSWHRYGLAVDVISKSKGWDAPDEFWSDLGLCARAEGLVWGGDWPRFADRPHVQFGAPMRQAPSSDASALYASGGAFAVWRAVGAA